MLCHSTFGAHCKIVPTHFPTAILIKSLSLRKFLNQTVMVRRGQARPAAKAIATSQGPPRRPSSKRLKETQGDHFAFTPDITPPPAKKPKGGWACLRCKRSPKEVEWAYHDPETRDPEREACERCFAPFARDWQREGTWHEVNEKLVASAELDADYERGAATLVGEAPLPFDPVSVSEDSEYEVAVRRSFVGIPRADFVCACDHAPAQLGFQEQDLVNEVGATFKGVLIVNPFSPYVEYTMTHSQRVNKASNRLPKERLCRERQAEDLFSLSRASQDNDKFVTKLRNCQLTLAKIESACGGKDLLSKFWPMDTVQKSAATAQVDSDEHMPDAASSKGKPSLERAPISQALVATMQTPTRPSALQRQKTQLFEPPRRDLAPGASPNAKAVVPVVGKSKVAGVAADVDIEASWA